MLPLPLPNPAARFPAGHADPPPSPWGASPLPLPSRFSRIKSDLIAGHEAALESSWARLVAALRSEVERIDSLGAHLIPGIEYADIHGGGGGGGDRDRDRERERARAQTARFRRDLRRFGVGIMRGVVPRAEADAAVRETVGHLEATSDFQASPLPHDPTCFDYFWTPAQVRTRAHPRVLCAQRFVMGLWGRAGRDDDDDDDDGDAAAAAAAARFDPRCPVAYADRLRIHGTTVPSRDRCGPDQILHIKKSGPLSRPGPAEDWLAALGSSCVVAQVDNGSLERWEHDGYQRAGTYTDIFEGCWEDWDPWDCASRVDASRDLYNGYGACNVFRMFQGLMTLSTVEPGIVRLLPSPKLATAYFLLRPFFRPRSPPPDTRRGPLWDAYLAPDNWALAPEQDAVIHGAVPGHAQRLAEAWHPHLELRRSMIPPPTLHPGDYVFWHPDLAYHVTSDSVGLGCRPDHLSMLVHLPAAPLTQTNALYLARQRNAFRRGHPGPDFDVVGSGRGSEIPPRAGRMTERDIAETGGLEALRAMGLAPWEYKPRGSARAADGNADTCMRDDGDELEETELLRLANAILFPERFPGGIGRTATGDDGMSSSL